MTDIEGNDVLDDSGDLPWEECSFISNSDSEKLSALNELLAQNFYIFDSYPVGDSIFVRLRKIEDDVLAGV